MGRRTISLDEMDRFEIDENTFELYWDGGKVVTEIRLPLAVNASIIAAGIGTCAGVVLTALAMFGVVKPPPPQPITVEVRVVMDGKGTGSGSGSSQP